MYVEAIEEQRPKKMNFNLGLNKKALGDADEFYYEHVDIT